MEKINITENQLNKIISESITRHLNEFFGRKQQMPEKPQSASDVLKGNGWVYKVVSSKPGEKVIRCYVSNNSSFRTALPFEELVEDLNIYYQDKGLPIKADGMEEYNGTEGAFMRVRKLQ